MIDWFSVWFIGSVIVAEAGLLTLGWYIGQKEAKQDEKINNSG